MAEFFFKAFSQSSRSFSRKTCLQELFPREHVNVWFCKNELHHSVTSGNFDNSKKVQGLSLQFVDLLFTVNDWGFLEGYPPFVSSDIKLTNFPESFVPSEQENFVIPFVSYSRNEFIPSSILFNMYHSPSITIC